MGATKLPFFVAFCLGLRGDPVDKSKSYKHCMELNFRVRVMYKVRAPLPCLEIDLPNSNGFRSIPCYFSEVSYTTYIVHRTLRYLTLYIRCIVPTV